MRNFHLYHSIRQLALALGGFVIAILLLESDGLKNWADRLEPGLLRTAALPVASVLSVSLQPLGFAGARNLTLDEAARMGWSDDEVRLARVTPKFRAEIAPAQPQTSHASPAKASEVLRPKSESVMAEASVSPIVGSVPYGVGLTPLAPIEKGKSRVVVLAGDSMMAVGFSTDLIRMANEHKNLHILRAFKSGTGLARPDVFNWMDQYPVMLGSEKPDVVIVAIGANDAQSFVVNGKVVPFGTEEWRKTYQSRVANFLSLMENTGARVLWVELPPMRSVVFNQRISLVNRIAYTVVSQDPQASWWSTVAFVGDTSGAFQEFTELPNGAMVRVRAPDGIHFADEGTSTMTAAVMKWLDPSLESADGARMLAPAKPATSDDSPSRTTIADARPKPIRN
jgi:hypothetical protein